MLPVLGAQTAFLVVQRQGEALQDRFEARKDNQAAMARFREIAANTTDVESLLRDRRALQTVLEAFQLEGEIDKRGIIRKVLTEPPGEQTSLANRMVDQRWRQLAQAFATSQPLAISAAEVELITTATLSGFAMNRMAGLTAEQVGALTTTQVASLASTQVAAISVAGIGGLETRDVAALSVTQVAALTVPQLAALGTAQIRALETQDIAALATSQIRALDSTQLAALTTQQIQAMSTEQLSVLNRFQSAGLSEAQRAALSPGQRGALGAFAAEPLRESERAAAAPRPFADAALVERIVEGTMINRFEKAMGEANPGLREALYFRRMIGSVTKIEGLMADRALVSVVRGALGLPESFAALDFEQQRDMLTRRVNLETFKDSREVDKMIGRYLALAAPQASASSPVTALFGGSGPSLNALIGSTLSLRA